MVGDRGAVMQRRASRPHRLGSCASQGGVIADVSWLSDECLNPPSPTSVRTYRRCFASQLPVRLKR